MKTSICFCVEVISISWEKGFRLSLPLAIYPQPASAAAISL
ncbi:hypothetical protein EV06_0996 [Prochlorococcus sp. MIT 0602]|nr:hypothetical protein EV06_0996 [Prochlorococcus sp. MIT 0602]KGG17403.1 hypothetical protein EV07_0842 [Prochlorococcus sp. MIT 0603]